MSYNITHSLTHSLTHSPTQTHSLTGQISSENFFVRFSFDIGRGKILSFMFLV